MFAVGIAPVLLDDAARRPPNFTLHHQAYVAYLAEKITVHGLVTAPSQLRVTVLNTAAHASNLFDGDDPNPRGIHTKSSDGTGGDGDGDGSANGNTQGRSHSHSRSHSRSRNRSRSHSRYHSQSQSHRQAAPKTIAARASADVAISSAAAEKVLEEKVPDAISDLTCVKLACAKSEHV
jgi:hypothetical protein